MGQLKVGANNGKAKHSQENGKPECCYSSDPNGGGKGSWSQEHSKVEAMLLLIGTEWKN